MNSYSGGRNSNFIFLKRSRDRVAVMSDRPPNMSAVNRYWATSSRCFSKAQCIIAEASASQYQKSRPRRPLPRVEILRLLVPSRQVVPPGGPRRPASLPSSSTPLSSPPFPYLTFQEWLPLRLLEHHQSPEAEEVSEVLPGP